MLGAVKHARLKEGVDMSAAERHRYDPETSRWVGWLFAAETQGR
jgi:hypothetical protein